jgi:hypothetical protein
MERFMGIVIDGAIVVLGIIGASVLAVLSATQRRLVGIFCAVLIIVPLAVATQRVATLGVLDWLPAWANYAPPLPVGAVLYVAGAAAIALMPRLLVAQSADGGVGPWLRHVQASAVLFVWSSTLRRQQKRHYRNQVRSEIKKRLRVVTHTDRRGRR